MKKRTDYVSNSSSCSFCIEESINTKTALDTLVELGEVPYELSDKFTIKIHFNNKDYKTVEKYLLENREGDDHYCWSINGDPDGDTVSYFEDINYLISKIKNTPNDVKQILTRVDIGCENNEVFAVSVLNMLYELFTKKNLNPSDKYSETEFRPEEGEETFLVKLGKMLKG